MDSALYEQDFVRWTEEQARAIRDAASARVNLPIDWENVAEEIDSLGRSQRTELRSRLRTIIAHLMKLEASSAAEPRPGWQETVFAQRVDIEGLLDDSPSLRRELPALIAWALPRALREARRNLSFRGEQPRIDLGQVQYDEHEVLGDWFPEQPPPPGRARRQRRDKSGIGPKQA